MGKRTNTASWMENQNRWQIKVQKDGIRKAFYSSKPGRAGQREANAKADAWLDDGIDNGSQHVAKALAAYLEDLQARVSLSHYRPAESRCKLWIEPVIGKVRVCDLNEQHLQNVINKAYVDGKLSKKSLKNIRSDLYAFCKYCRKAKLTTFMPEDISIPTSAAKSEITILQPDDLKVLFSDNTILFRGKSYVEPCVYAFRLQVLTGLRPGELLGLQKSDRHGHLVYIRRSRNAYEEFTSGKNDNAQRTIVLTELAQQNWDALVAEFPTEKELLPYHNQNQYYNRLRAYCRSHNLPAVSPYGLRHTFVSVAKTLPEGLVKDLVGHSAQMDTFGVYGHALKNDSSEIRVAIDSRFLELLKQKK